MSPVESEWNVITPEQARRMQAIAETCKSITLALVQISDSVDALRATVESIRSGASIKNRPPTPPTTEHIDRLGR